MKRKRRRFILELVLNLFCVAAWIFITIVRYLRDGLEFLTILSGIAMLAWIGRTVYDIRKYSAESKKWKNQTKGE
ncbi:MAG: hypothetical protein IJM85_03240 [Clostridia bacterium]|nr:hypothetical protein [Clostridia bacterium]